MIGDEGRGGNVGGVINSKGLLKVPYENYYFRSFLKYIHLHRWK